MATLLQPNRLLRTAALFGGGGLITALFSGSLARIAAGVPLSRVLLVGLVVPSFTWLVHLGASWMRFNPADRRAYWADLGWTCLLGSIALLPAACLNIVAPHPSWWLSAANVLASVALMAAVLFHRSAKRGVPAAWPIAWCATIACNMALFFWMSAGWW